MEEQQERSLMEICLELSSHREDNAVIPVILEHYTNIRDYKMNHYQSLGQLYQKYMPNSYKVGK